MVLDLYPEPITNVVHFLHLTSSPSSNMVEYTPLMSIPPEDDGYGYIEPKESRQKTHSTRYLLPITALVALLASFAAAAFHLNMLSDPQPLLAPKEIASSLRMVKPTPNLEKGRETMVEMNLKCACCSVSPD
jgi:hypothetical protein